MQVKKPLRCRSLVRTVFDKVEKHFGQRLPPEWVDVVLVSIHPRLGVLKLPAPNPFRDCLVRNEELTMEILKYARDCWKEYDPETWADSKPGEGGADAKLIRAALVRYWRTSFIKKEGKWHPLELQDLPSKTPPVALWQLQDKEIADWLGREYRNGKNVATGSVKAARQSLSKRPGATKRSSKRLARKGKK